MSAQTNTIISSRCEHLFVKFQLNTSSIGKLFDSLIDWKMILLVKENSPRKPRKKRTKKEKASKKLREFWMKLKNFLFKM